MTQKLHPAIVKSRCSVVIRVSSLQDESENVKRSAEESHLKAVDQSEQLMVVMATLKEEHSKVI